MWEISRVVGMAFLTGLSVEDIRFRKLSGELMGTMLFLGITYHIFRQEISWIMVLGGIGIGMVFLGVSYITREALGYGDSIVICILGVFVGAAELIEMLVMTWVTVSIVAMVLLFYRHFSRKASLPFIPFLTLGYGVVTLGTYIGEMSGGLR